MADALLRKLQHRAEMPVLVLWAPDELAPVIDGWEGQGVTVHRRIRGNSPFVVAFFRSCAEIERNAAKIVNALGGDDPLVWLAYPKKSSKRYTSDIGRDDSWQPMGDRGFEPVRQIAIGDDWSALRFRRTGNVKTMTRSRAISAEGKQRLATKKATGGDDTELQAWFDARPEPRRSTLRAVHDLVRAAAPKLSPSVAGKSVGYGAFHYIYATGREGDAHRLVLADNARYVSLYVLAGDEGGYLAEQAASRLGKVSVGKSCIRFKRIDDVDVTELRKVVKAAAARHQEVERS